MADIILRHQQGNNDKNVNDDTLVNVTDDNKTASSEDEQVTTPSTVTRPRRCARNRKPPANNTTLTTVDKTMKMFVIQPKKLQRRVPANALRPSYHYRIARSALSCNVSNYQDKGGKNNLQISLWILNQ